jgi:hypothetical protein
MEELIAEWKAMKASLEAQLAHFEPPMNMHTHTDHKDTTKKSKKRVQRCIEELDELLEIHDADRT